jgi:hypothetical protein
VDRGLLKKKRAAERLEGPRGNRGPERERRAVEGMQGRRGGQRAEERTES